MDQAMKYRAAPQMRQDRGHRCERALWAAVVETALEDIAGTSSPRTPGRRQWAGSPEERAKSRDDSRRYLRSEWFEIHCFWLGLDPDAIREGIERRGAEVDRG